MHPFPDDIFTEPEHVDPDTLANLGPLRRLAGTWEGRKGVDLNPKAEGPEQREFVERIEFQPIDAQANGPQLFFGLRYHTHILATDEDPTFHDQVGYWLWEPATGLVLQSVSIPRGQVALAAGHAAADATSLVVQARRGETEYGICSTAFSGARLPHRRLPADGHLQSGRHVELRLRYDDGREGSFRALPASGPEHAFESR